MDSLECSPEMAENNDWPAWVLGLGGVLTAIGAAVKSWKRKPIEDNEMQVLKQRVSELERRANDTDARLAEVFDLMHGVNESLGKCQSDIREALTRLDERRKR